MSNQPEKKQTIEEIIFAEFTRKSQHLSNHAATKAMQQELLAIASPYHAKLKEIGYPPEMSKTMLGKAFDHQPPRTAWAWLGKNKLTVFN